MKTNPERGHVAMQVGGESYTMQLSPHALVVLKEKTGLGLKGLIAELQKAQDEPDFELIGAIVWASMQDHHPDMSLREASGLFPDGGIEEIVAKIGELFKAAFPKSNASAGAAANPPKAATTKK